MKTITVPGKTTSIGVRLTPQAQQTTQTVINKSPEQWVDVTDQSFWADVDATWDSITRTWIAKRNAITGKWSIILNFMGEYTWEPNGPSGQPTKIRAGICPVINAADESTAYLQGTGTGNGDYTESFREPWYELSFNVVESCILGFRVGQNTKNENSVFRINRIEMLLPPNAVLVRKPE